MIVMPANASGWGWHSLARETGRLGHLFSPRAQRGPWPWFPYALDNGAFSCWEPVSNTFDDAKWADTELAWHQLLFWAQAVEMRARWAIVPDVPGNAEGTLDKWEKYSAFVTAARIPLAVAVQDGMTPAMVKKMLPAPAMICIGGSTEWKWDTVANWCKHFPRVHLLRCNAPLKLDYLEKLGVESTDGTGWSRGDRKQTKGLHEWCQARAVPTTEPIWPHMARKKCPKQSTFA